MSNQIAKRLALGTVQFGLHYGIANKDGQTSLGEATKILEVAAAHGVNTLDTAVAYGDSERRLGDIGVSEWRVITKVPPVPENCGNVGTWLRENVAGSLARLRVKTLSGLLLHRSSDLLSAHGTVLFREMRRLRSEGLVEKIGVSVYGPSELEALSQSYTFDLVQAPYNVVDRRLSDSGWLQRLDAAGVEVHVRSVFLQGLLLMQPQQRPARFEKWQALWSRWERWLADENLTPLQGCLQFALLNPSIARLVIGVDHAAHLEEILYSIDGRTLRAPDSLSSIDRELINPLSWISS